MERSRTCRSSGLFLARRPDQVDFILLARELRGDAAPPPPPAASGSRTRPAGGAPAAIRRRSRSSISRRRCGWCRCSPTSSAAVEDVEVALLYPDGHAQELLLIDDYDAKWPASFHLREPLIAPAGSRLVLSGSLRAGADGAAGRPFDLEVGYALDDHLVLPPPQVAASPQPQGGMLVGADIEGAVALLPKGVSSTPPSMDPRAAAHMDHSPLHGGQFFMAANSYHHLEGALPRPGEFDLYVYDDYKRPLDPRNFAGEVVFETFDKGKNEWNETSYPLERGGAGGAVPAGAHPRDHAGRVLRLGLARRREVTLRLLLRAAVTRADAGRARALRVARPPQPSTAAAGRCPRRRAPWSLSSSSAPSCCAS